MRASASAHIRTGALRHNLAELRRHAPGHPVMAVIKGDGYGHGLLTVARVLDDADAFAVARVEEALSLRDAGIRQPIVLLEGVFDAEDLALSQAHGLDIVVHCEEQLRLVEEATLAAPLDVWLKVDTGMHRLGIRPEHTIAAVERLRRSANVEELRLMTHFARADETAEGMTSEQIRRLAAAAGGFEGTLTLANSAAILAWKSDLGRFRAEFPTAGPAWIRPGISLYGVSPFAQNSGEELGLEPAMDLRSVLIAVKTVRAGEKVGYGARYVARSDMRLGVAAAGYADGYPWRMPDGTPVLVGGRRVRLAGRVSMDMITVDLSDVPDAAVGDDVLLWGRGLPVEEIARAAETSPYELLCRVTARVIRETA